MPNTEPSPPLSRAQQKIHNRSRIRARSSTPEKQLKQLDKLIEEQHELQEMIRTPLPTAEDQGEESGYDPDPEDCDQEQETDVYTDMEKFEIPKDLLTQPPQPETRSRHVTFADQIGKSSSPPQLPPPQPPLLPPLEKPLPPPPILPPRTCSHLLNTNHNNYPRSGSAIATLRVGKCTTPRTFGQGYDPPFLYPEFIAKDQQSRVNYILTLVDSLVLQMERFGSLILKPKEDATAEGLTKPASKGAIPKVRPANCDFKRFPKGNRNRTDSKPSSKFKKKHSKNTNANQEVEYDMDYEFCMDHIEEFRANRVRGGSHYYFDDKDPDQEKLWHDLREKQGKEAQEEKKKAEEAKEEMKKAEEAQEKKKAEEAQKEKKKAKEAQEKKKAKIQFNQWLVDNGY